MASGSTDARIVELRRAVSDLEPIAVDSGVPYGAVAISSAFILMFKGRTATFAGLVNRPLVGGLAATLLLAALFGLRWPSLQDWMSVLLITIAVSCLARAQRRRRAEPAAVVQ